MVLDFDCSSTCHRFRSYDACYPRRATTARAFPVDLLESNARARGIRREIRKALLRGFLSLDMSNLLSHASIAIHIYHHE